MLMSGTPPWLCHRPRCRCAEPAVELAAVDGVARQLRVAPAETEVEYEPVTVTVTSPLPETTVLPFAAIVTVLPSPPPEATLSAEMVVSFATTHVDVPSTFTVMGASLAVPVPEPAAALSVSVAAAVSKSSSVLFCSTTSAVVLVK